MEPVICYLLKTSLIINYNHINLMKLQRAYGGVTIMVSIVTGNYLIIKDYERLQRERTFRAEITQFLLGDIHNV